MVTDAASENQELLFSHKIRIRANRVRSWLCIGLDPEPDRLPVRFARDATGVEEFCREIVAATCEYAAAYKPNVAFFEAFGSDGWAALVRLLASIPRDVPVIADAKRGDIGNTARAYARAFFEVLNVDALTVNPYLGPDSLEPFMAYPGRCVFVLCKTSNPGSTRVQDRPVNGEPLYLDVASWALAMAGPAEVGLVVGATQEEATRAVRSRHPDAVLLLPGVGAQGARMAPTMKMAAGSESAIALPSVSREILYASAGADFAQQAAHSARRLAVESWTPQGSAHARH